MLLTVFLLVDDQYLFPPLGSTLSSLSIILCTIFFIA